MIEGFTDLMFHVKHEIIKILNERADMDWNFLLLNIAIVLVPGALFVIGLWVVLPKYKRDKK